MGGRLFPAPAISNGCGSSCVTYRKHASYLINLARPMALCDPLTISHRDRFTISNELYYHSKLLIYGFLFWLSFLCLPIGAGSHNAVFAQQAAAPAAALEKLEIITSRGTHVFAVEVMRSEEERERGLMFRESLPEDQGMLFDFKTERVVMMWMKNTYLPLDMIFMSRAGKVVAIAKDALPLSEKIISSGVPASAVLEVNAGTAERIGLRTGDFVRHPIFGGRGNRKQPP